MSQLMVDNQGCTDFEEGRHSLSIASRVSGHHRGSRSSGLPSSDSTSAKPESDEVQHVGTRDSPQVEFSRCLEYRILPIIWICYFWDKQLEKVFTQQNISVENATATEKLEERQRMELAVVAFYIGRTIGVWFGILAMMVEEFSRVIPTSIFLTSVFASLLNFYSEQDSSLRVVCYTLCALSSSPLMPAAILLTRVCYGKLIQPLRCIIWATAGPIAISIGEVNLHIGGKTNAPILIQGLFFGMLSLAIEPWMEKTKPGLAPWSLSQRAILVFDTESYPNNWTRFQALWKSYKHQVRSSLTDHQLYFFLLFAIMDVSTKREVNELSERNFADALAQASPLISYYLAGSVLYRFKIYRIIAFLMCFSIFAEASGWWLFQVCLDKSWQCSPLASWAVSLVPALGEITITLSIILLIANVRGRIRSFFVVAIFCTGHALGGLARTLLMIRFSIHQWRQLVLIASTVKLVCFLLYVGRASYINLKRIQEMNAVETELIGASRESVLLEEDMDFEDDRFLFTY